MEQVTVAIPRGIPPSKDGSAWIQKAQIRKLNGFDEQLVLELSQTTPPLHSKVLALLERITSFEGKLTATGDILKQLSLGDRASLMLSARKLVFGDVMSCIIRCINCGKDMSIDLSITELQSVKTLEPQKYYEVDVHGYRVQVRPLTSVDQERLFAAADLSEHDLEQELAKACLVEFCSDMTMACSGGGGGGNELPGPLVEAVGMLLAEADPLSDVILSIVCPECGHPSEVSLAVEEYIFEEFALRTQQLEREVHWLAFHYHWNETEILSLSTEKRRRYVELVNATLAGETI
ncbi:MAG: hypothetical protein M3M89_07155 [Thermoproteota archaeon]|nr:hypothetical protein [Thermoproteota archaeon]